jgi:hypothetical protein
VIKMGEDFIDIHEIWDELEEEEETKKKMGPC